MNRRLLILCIVAASLANLNKEVFAAPLIGVHIQEESLSEYTNRLELARQLGIKVVRVPVDWNALEWQQNNPDINYVNEIKARVANAQGQQVILMLSQTPEWANGGNAPTYPPTPSHYQDFADAMVYLHQQLLQSGDNDDINASSILAWEVWNEPNIVDFWPTHGVRNGAFALIELSAASEYAQLLAQTYDTMKSNYPGVPILGGSLASGDTAYLNAMYDHWNGDTKFDALSLHPYSRVDENEGPHYAHAQYPEQCNNEPLSPPWCYKLGVENIRTMMNSHNDDDKEIWFTEFGVSSGQVGNSNNNYPGWGNSGSESEQQVHLNRSLDILAAWDTMKIPVAIWYQLKDQVSVSEELYSGEGLFGLYHLDSSLKPSGSALQSRLDSSGRLIVDAPIPVSPANGSTVTTMTPSFEWQSVSNANSYLLWVNKYNDSGDIPGIINSTYTPSQAGCQNGGNCSVAPGVNLGEGDAEWWITAIFSDGSSAESHGNFFTMVVKNDVIIDFGDTYGLWLRMNNTNWVQLHNLSAESINAANLDANNQDEIIIDFGAAYGIWLRMNNSSWVKLHSLSPESLVTGDIDGSGQDDIIIDFGAAYGIWLWMNNSSWVQLHSISPNSMVTGDVDGNGQDEVIIDFGVGIWVRMNNSSWVQLHSISPESMVTGDIDGSGQDDVIIDFGASYGIWLWMNNSSWVQLHSISPNSMVTGDVDGNGQDEVIIDFGTQYGIWVRMNNSSWTQIHSLSPNSMVTGDLDSSGQDDVIIDFGAGIWVRMNNSSWVQLHSISPESMVTGNID